MNISKQVVILSAERSEHNDEQNAARTEILKGCLQDCGIGYDVGVGVYDNGPEEVSIVAVVNNNDDLEAVSDFAFKNFQQDSILVQDANQEAHLVASNGNTLQLGRLVRVTKEEAIAQGSYTLLNNVYYATKQR